MLFPLQAARLDAQQQHGAIKRVLGYFALRQIESQVNVFTVRRSPCRPCEESAASAFAPGLWDCCWRHSVSAPRPACVRSNSKPSNSPSAKFSATCKRFADSADRITGGCLQFKGDVEVGGSKVIGQELNLKLDPNHQDCGS